MKQDIISVEDPSVDLHPWMAVDGDRHSPKVN